MCLPGLKFNNQSQGFFRALGRAKSPQIGPPYTSSMCAARKGEPRARSLGRATPGNIVKVRLRQRLYHLEEYEIFSASLYRKQFSYTINSSSGIL
jgi:hypothetical protein